MKSMVIQWQVPAPRVQPTKSSGISAGGGCFHRRKSLKMDNMKRRKWVLRFLLAESASGKPYTSQFHCQKADCILYQTEKLNSHHTRLFLSIDSDCLCDHPITVSSPIIITDDHPITVSSPRLINMETSNPGTFPQRLINNHVKRLPFFRNLRITFLSWKIMIDWHKQ